MCIPSFCSNIHRTVCEKYTLLRFFLQFYTRISVHLKPGTYRFTCNVGSLHFNAGEGGGGSDVQEVRLHCDVHGRRRGGFWKQLLVEAQVRQPALRVRVLCSRRLPIEGGGNFGGSSNQAFFEVRSAWTQAQAESSTPYQSYFHQIL